MLSLEDKLSLSQRVLGVIEKAIINGSIRPGERLVEVDLARKLGISKSPVREALKQLEGEGIVQLAPRKGYFVRNILDRKSINDFFDAFFIIEPEVAILSLNVKTKVFCKKLDHLLKKMRFHLNKSDFDLYTSLNDEFHASFYKFTDNEFIIKLSQVLRNQASILRSLSLHTKDRFFQSMEEHAAIVHAYKKGDQELLLKAVKYHLTMLKDNILKSTILKEAEGL